MAAPRPDTNSQYRMGRSLVKAKGRAVIGSAAAPMVVDITIWLRPRGTQ